ncbi:MAG: carbohydrate kinase family protein [Eubacteriales bacterium]
MREGICVAGNLIVDILYPIESYPGKSELTTITNGIARSTGGAACNVTMDLASLDPNLPLSVIGILGEDTEADFVAGQFEKYKNIDISNIKRKGVTSFTAVMCENTTKARTFFHYRGANAILSEEDFNWKSINSRILHIGYILLLDVLDQPDEEYGTKMARLLAKTQKEGIKTSIDVVSEVGNRFERLVPPALKYVDYCIINELETQQATKIPLRGEDGALLEENMKPALEKLFSMGVSTWAVIHAPEGGFGMDKSGQMIRVKSLELPAGYIKGTVGAGDAFCAGVLFAAYQNVDLQQAIVMGIASAACSLSQPGSTEGMKTMKEALSLYDSLKK